MTFSSTAPTGTAYADAFGLTVNWSASTPTDTKYRACLLLHKDAICHAEQMGIRTQADYMIDFLGTAVVSDTIYGVKELRDYAGLAIIVPS